ncbi:23S rRNA (guanosine(2251)-2'-O)-methyltransferase RlmB [Wenzhouxiangella marina]|uniref:23S rRNA (guanosine-2'-O-)-methyltransferase RlmB n=1 Tax=Wenzhouxiangella marina TaxID=1579979 RepID=A0A0K0XWG9_9GAMM|nr:23S rRNA (guanosine(2251)-2'-O)-methyltransferase RlmB [Wenzhouxiangella marina]AKS42028.1 23S rRNA methyltransferase [Wenzhouxiangella marina]MBB6086204.1 23S rRNA (guanosine2251-2'-O)-methyltransferase [Wenzhouxiangella marina]
MKRELAMGINAVEGLVQAAPERIVRVWAKRGNARLDALTERLQAASVPIEWVDERALDRRAGGVRHQGVIAEFQARQAIDESELLELVDAEGREALLLVLDNVQDPHNLGACLRSALAAGACAVVVPKDRAAGLSPVVRRAAAGAAERIPLAVVTNLARTLDRLADHGLFRVGLAGETELSLYDADLTGPLALVMGGEDRGLRRLTRERCDQLVRIPMPGAMESLNVSVAAGIGLFEAVRQRSVV